MASDLVIVPVTFRQAVAFVRRLHRHNAPPPGAKFCIGVAVGGELVGVAMAGRPVARAFDDGWTLEVNRTCTDGARNANSALYGAVWRAAKSMGYLRCVTYTQGDESGSSLRAAGWVKRAELASRKSWAASTGDPALKAIRDPVGTGGVERVRWEIATGVDAPAVRGLELECAAPEVGMPLLDLMEGAGG